MGRRFPTPIIGVVTDPSRYRVIAKIAAKGSKNITQSSFVERCQRQLTKPDSDEQYSREYARRIISTYVTLGIMTRDKSEKKTRILPSPFAEDFLNQNLSFSEFIWNSIKRSWVAMGNKPEGIEGLDRVLRVLEDESGLKKGEIKSRLGNEYGYEFNDQGIRGYPEILQILGVIEKHGYTYQTSQTDSVNRFKRRFRNCDVFRTLESRLKREGTTVNPPGIEAKRDLMKYYMYREAGGWSKRRQWYETFWEDYLQPTTREGDAGSELRREEGYRRADNKRQRYKTQICDKFESFNPNSLTGLSETVLNRIVSADDEIEAQRIRVAAGSGISKADLQLLENNTRPEYSFGDSFELYDWQSESADSWFKGGVDRPAKQGIAQVVTGAGKTVMALEVLRRWIARGEDRIATIIVPSNVLMQQWLTELVSTLNVPVRDIGWAGGGHKDDLDQCRILVSIINSAVRGDYLESSLEDSSWSEHLLIADECHRYTGDKFSNVFECPRSASLGLSATAVTKNGSEQTAGDELLLNELGDIYYELTYDEGIQRGLIPEFSLKYVGFDLVPQERSQYERLSGKVSNAIKDIHQRHEHRMFELSGGFAQKLQIIRDDSEKPTPAITDYFEYTQERRELVDNAAARQAITLRLLRETVENDHKAIVFQERIKQLERLIAPYDRRGIDPKSGELVDDSEGYRAKRHREFDGLKQIDEQIEKFFARPDYWPVMYHSGHSQDIWNDFAIEWFRQDDMADVMLSVKALIEGVDIPSADVGIVRVSSSSIRQRIQTLGRILRTGGDSKDGSTLYVLYARNTVDERIFTQYDWQGEFASAHVEQKIWEPDPGEGLATGSIRDAEPEEYPPRPEPEVVPDPDDLQIGEEYTGPREPVKKVSVDSQGDLFEKHSSSREYIKKEGFEEQIQFMTRMKNGGSIIINEHNHMITVLQDGPVFLGTVESPDVFEPAESDRNGLTSEPEEFEDIF